MGANGFVGRHVVRAVQQRARVRALVRSAEGASSLAKEDCETLVTGGLGDVTALCEGIRDSEAVVHTGGISVGTPGARRVDRTGICNLIEACVKTGVKRFLYVSGLGVHRYGMKAHCTNEYFLAKLIGEVELFQAPFEVVVLRPSYIFGPGEDFLNPLLRAIRTSNQLEIPGSGEYRLQPIFVSDMADLVVRLLEMKLAGGQTVMDVVGPEVLSYRNLILRATESLGQTIALTYRPEADAVEMARIGRYQGLRAHELACLLCDEVSDAEPVSRVLGRPLATLETMFQAVS